MPARAPRRADRPAGSRDGISSRPSRHERSASSSDRRHAARPAQVPRADERKHGRVERPPSARPSGTRGERRRATGVDRDLLARRAGSSRSSAPPRCHVESRSSRRPTSPTAASLAARARGRSVDARERRRSVPIAREPPLDGRAGDARPPPAAGAWRESARPPSARVSVQSAAGARMGRRLSSYHRCPTSVL